MQQGDSLTNDLDRYDDAKFWPFVGALKPWKRPDGLDQWKWDDFEDTVAFCGLNKARQIGHSPVPFLIDCLLVNDRQMRGQSTLESSVGHEF